MGFEAYDLAKSKYQANVERLDNIARFVVQSRRGDFLKRLAEAWLRADIFNKRILLPAWEAIVTKYSLTEEADVP